MLSDALRIFAPFWLRAGRKKTYAKKTMRRRKLLDVAALSDDLKRDMGFLDGRRVRKDCDLFR